MHQAPCDPFKETRLFFFFFFSVFLFPFFFFYFFLFIFSFFCICSIFIPKHTASACAVAICRCKHSHGVNLGSSCTPAEWSSVRVLHSRGRRGAASDARGTNILCSHVELHHPSCILCIPPSSFTTHIF